MSALNFSRSIFGAKAAAVSKPSARGARTHENTRSELVRSMHVPVDGSRRTAATFRFARFLFSSPSSFLPTRGEPFLLLLPSHEEPVRARAGHGRGTATDTSSSSRFTLSSFSCLSSCPSSGRFVAAGLFLLFCRLFVVGVFFDGCLRAALFQTRKTVARGRLIDGGFLGAADERFFFSSLLSSFFFFVVVILCFLLFPQTVRHPSLTARLILRIVNLMISRNFKILEFLEIFPMANF